MATQTRQAVFSARRFIGKDVFDSNGDHVGEVEDIVLGLGSGCAEWLMLSTGGFAGIGEKHHIVPMETVAIEEETGRIGLSFEGGRLENGPRYDRDNPPDWSDRDWTQSVRSYYGMGGGQGGMSYQQGYRQGYQQGVQQGVGSQQGSQQGTQQGRWQRIGQERSQGQGMQQGMGSQGQGTQQGMGSQGQGMQQGMGSQGDYQQGSTQGSQQGQGQRDEDRDWLKNT